MRVTAARTPCAPLTPLLRRCLSPDGPCSRACTCSHMHPGLPCLLAVCQPARPSLPAAAHHPAQPGRHRPPRQRLRRAAALSRHRALRLAGSRRKGAAGRVHGRGARGGGSSLRSAGLPGQVALLSRPGGPGCCAAEGRGASHRWGCPPCPGAGTPRRARRTNRRVCCPAAWAHPCAPLRQHDWLTRPAGTAHPSSSCLPSVCFVQVNALPPPFVAQFTCTIQVSPLFLLSMPLCSDPWPCLPPSENCTFSCFGWGFALQAGLHLPSALPSTCKVMQQIISSL